MRIALFVIVSSIAGAWQYAYADVIGRVPRESAGFGYAFGAGTLSVDDPDGPTGEEFVMQPLALVYTEKLAGGKRIWLEPYYQNAAFDASTDRIGQDVTRFGLRGSLQQFVVPAARFMPWLGAGLDVSHNTYDSRHTIDADGYLANRYPDRRETNVALLFNALREWKLADGRSVHAKFEYLTPLGGDISSLSISLAYLFTY